MIISKKSEPTSNPYNSVDHDDGLYEKYIVFKVADLTGEDGMTLHTKDLGVEPIDGFVFVLRVDQDYHARVALAAYAESVYMYNPELAEDLRDALRLMDPAPRTIPD